MAKKRARRTMGFLVRGLEPNDSYNYQHWAAMYELAREREADLLMAAGGVLDDPESLDRAHSAIFRLIGRDLVDGALVSTTVTYRLTSDGLAQFDEALGRLPSVGMSVALGRRSTVAVDNVIGMTELIRHLIEVHGCRRIVHVRGPYPNEEAARREAVWRSELERAGIAVRPEWLVPAGFEQSALHGIGRRIIDQAGSGFDAVVACNDLAAHQVIAEFQRLGYRVPEDYAVCGFDDIEKSRHTRPSLTTVTQPLAEVTRLAWDELEQLFERRKPRSVSVPARLVIRSSCGCPEPHAGTAAEEIPAMVSRYERAMIRFQSSVYDLHNFIRAMNRVTEAEQLVPVLHEWLPRLGVPRFAVLRTSTAAGDPREHLCRWTDDALPSAPSYFSVLTAWPDMEQRVIPGDQFSLSSWLSGLSPFVVGLFPLVTGDTWHGLAALELSRTAGLLELALQEQLASALSRVAHETRVRETETLRRYAAEVAQEITLPLAAVSSAYAVIDAKLSRFAKELKTLAGEPDFERVTAFLAQLDDLPSSTATLGAAADQISSYVNELRRSLLK